MFFAVEGPTIQLVPDGTLLFHLLLVVVMVVVLNATLLKPINRILEERDKRTKGRLSEAQATLLSVEQSLRDYETRLREARSEGYALLERQRTDISAERERKLAQVKDEISKQTLNQRQQLGRETEAAKGSLQAGAHSLAVDISRRILGRPIASQ